MLLAFVQAYTLPSVYGNSALQRQVIEFFAGDDHVQPVTVYQQPGSTALQNLTGWTSLQLLVKGNAEESDSHARLTLTATIVDITNGGISFVFLSADTAPLRGTYQYKITGIDPAGHHQTLCVGPLLAWRD